MSDEILTRLSNACKALEIANESLKQAVEGLRESNAKLKRSLDKPVLRVVK